jgi:4-hydroxy-4-methyl-2-oxoglutarate aldolase
MVDVIRQFESVSDNDIERASKLSAATIFEANYQSGMMDPKIRGIYREAKVFGRALTVNCHVGDNLMIHKAVTVGRPGDVMVVSIGNDDESGAWGEILTTAAMARGIIGLIIDGGVRDVEAIERRGFPVFSRGIAVGATMKRNRGTINHPITCGNVLVRPGDLVVGDIDGIVIVPREVCGSVLDASYAREEKEAVMMKELAAGKTTLELLNLDPILKSLGVEDESV